jgi:hypothetical protein
MAKKLKVTLTWPNGATMTILQDKPKKKKRKK